MLSIGSERASRAFQRLRIDGAAELGRFTGGAQLVAWLNDDNIHMAADRDEKDRLLGALVGAAAADPAAANLAIELLLLGLWPGLSAGFYRLMHLFRGRPDDLVIEILDRFTVCVRRLDLARCQRVAATLVWNTERVIRTARRCELARAARNRRLAPESEILADPAAGHAAGLVDLRAWLEGVVPRDADLVIGVLVGGQNCREAGRDLGMSHAAARQRLARALARLRMTDRRCERAAAHRTTCVRAKGDARL